MRSPAVVPRCTAVRSTIVVPRCTAARRHDAHLGELGRAPTTVGRPSRKLKLDSLRSRSEYPIHAGVADLEALGDRGISNTLSFQLMELRGLDGRRTRFVRARGLSFG